MKRKKGNNQVRDRLGGAKQLRKSYSMKEVIVGELCSLF